MTRHLPWLLAVLLLLPALGRAQTSITLPGDGGGLGLGNGALANQAADRAQNLLSQFQPRRGGIIALMGYNMSPDGSANSLQVTQGQTLSGGNATQMNLSQFGAGFTWDPSFPLYTEGFVGYARYDPRFLFTSNVNYNQPFRWNNLALTLGVGWDFHLTESWVLRPIFNVAGGGAASDVSLFGRFIEYKTDLNADPLTKRQVLVRGTGGSLVLAYYDKRPTRDIDLEIRYTQLWLETFGETMQIARGSSVPRTLGIWARYRWPMGVEAFGRPMRWVVDSNFTSYVGDQAKALGFNWAAKIGGGIEWDVGRYEAGAAGLYLSRVRLIGRYMIGDNNISGYSIGLGFSF